MASDAVEARGLTDILAPLKLAIALLEGCQGAPPRPPPLGKLC